MHAIYRHLPKLSDSAHHALGRPCGFSVARPLWTRQPLRQWDKDGRERRSVWHIYITQPVGKERSSIPCDVWKPSWRKPSKNGVTCNTSPILCVHKRKYSYVVETVTIYVQGRMANWTLLL